MNKILGWLSSDLFGTIGKSIDELITSDEERIKLKNEIQQKILEQNLNTQKLQTEIINTEGNGNFLQRSWRPILMLSFGFVVIYTKFIAPCFNLQNVDLEIEFWELLNVGIGGYVIGRSVEKVSESLGKNLKK